MSSIASYDSDNASGFWDPPSKPIKEEFKNEEDQESNNFSDSYQESLSESDVVSEKELGCAKELESKDYNNNKNGRIRNGKAEDAGKPFYVPRKPHFFEHDIRILDDEEDVREKRKRNVRKAQDSNCWNHDLFIEDEQKPKSKRELIDMYGYDIRSDSPSSIGESSSRERRPKRQQSYYNPDNHPKYNINFEEMEKESQKHKLRMDSTQSAHKFGRGFTERNSCKRVSPKKTSSTTNSYDVDILKMENLSIHQSETKNKVLNRQDRPVDYIPVTYPGSKRRDPPPPKIVFLDREKNNLKYVVNPGVVNNADRPNCSQTRQKDSSNLKDNTITLHSKENRVTITENKYEKRGYNLKLNGAYNENKSVHGPLNVSERKFFELDKNDEVFDSLVPVNAAPSAYNYFNGLYNEGNRENFEFPDPPDLSANHLMPCIPQQQYFLHPYYQQGLGSLMKWEFYGQPYYQRGSLGDVAFIKQQYFDSWASPHQSNVISSTQHVDSSPFYAVQDNVKIIQRDTEVKCVSTVERADQVASVPVHRTSHRYSYVRAMLHQVHSAKILKPDDGKEQ